MAIRTFAAGIGVFGSALIASAIAFYGAAESQRGPAPRSTILYRPERIALRMSHASPAHAALPCTRCHTTAETSTSASDLLIPGENACNPCHADRTDRSRESESTCSFCHVGFGENGTHVVPESHFPAPRIVFSHKAHAQIGVPCAGCHEGLHRAGLGTRAHLPTMQRCLSCHSDRAQLEPPPASLAPTPASRAPAPTACRTCHLTEPDGVLQTHFPEGTLTPPRWLRGMAHDADWLVRHRWIGADQGSDCAACHRESDCADCHDGRVRPRRIHPNDWLTIHPQPARRDENRCATCHHAATFCAECHSRLGLATFSAPATRPETRYHPPQDLWIRGPNRHAREATRSLATCATCHGESDCVECHGTQGPNAIHRSPHPTGFTENCGTAFRANARACFACHGDRESLVSRCAP